jgi:enoyl-CoA hydratase/carnithine racemase
MVISAAVLKLENSKKICAVQIAMAKRAFLANLDISNLQIIIGKPC